MSWRDEGGYVKATPQTREPIIRGGEKIEPDEVETVLKWHPKVKEAAVIGVPDAELGQEIKAILIFKPGEKPAPDELSAFVKGRLGPNKVPKYYAFPSGLPRDQGKLLEELRKLYGEAKDG